jgi:hypothetical protein
VPTRSIRFDDANTRIPVPTETGNLIVDLPGRGTLRNANRLLFLTHMDTVPLCAGAKPKLQGRKIVNQAKTALGGDNRTGCAVLVTLAAELHRQRAEHPPLTLVAPERGISSMLVLAQALVAVRAGSWFGKVEKNGRAGTRNVGLVSGANDGPAGIATNVVTDYVRVLARAAARTPSSSRRPRSRTGPRSQKPRRL